MNKNTAAEMFGKMLFEQGVEQSSPLFMKLLNEPRGTHKAKWQAAKEWYEQESADKQALIRFLIQQAAILSTFHIAYKLDEGLDEKHGQVVNYTVAVNTYKDRDAANEDLPDETVQICPTVTGEDIHDIVMSYVDQLEANQHTG